MAKKVSSFKSPERGCLICKGQCWDPNQSKRQANARNFFKGPIPNSCVDSEFDGPKCPYKP